ncbi:histidine protein methyltransferase 1 homolog [Dermacentor silvarum]|uniref:histidine protein methyltransferase 1 homolog n=1 Tax=Dermacentor silvarum TaxID=543639 RepID=UPI0018982196|nr:histidine protein methyltransferase 1 homolog [Dermacentor silvarum]
MSFSFKFDIPDAEGAILNQDEHVDSECKHLTKPVAPYEEVVPRQEHENRHESLEKSVLDLTSIKVIFLVGGQMESLLRGDVLEATEGNLDIVPSVYEGGMKVWECSVDLAEYIENQLSIDDEAKVLELGCGAGLPGLVACLKGASVDFQDYNKQVLDLITIPNAFANIGARVKKRCHFFAGDWSALVDNILPAQYDFILTSETIYNTASYQSLIAVLKKAIKHTGIVLVAAKTCYFGVGGGTRLFEDALAVDGFFTSRVVFVTDSGVQREILELRVMPPP